VKMKLKVEEIEKFVDDGCSLAKDALEDIADVWDLVTERFTKPKHDELIRLASGLKKSLGAKAAGEVLSTLIGAEAVKKQSLHEGLAEAVKHMMPLASLIAQVHTSGKQSVGELFGWVLSKDEAN